MPKPVVVDAGQPKPPPPGQSKPPLSQIPTDGGNNANSATQTKIADAPNHPPMPSSCNAKINKKSKKATGSLPLSKKVPKRSDPVDAPVHSRKIAGKGLHSKDVTATSRGDRKGAGGRAISKAPVAVITLGSCADDDDGNDVSGDEGDREDDEDAAEEDSSSESDSLSEESPPQKPQSHVKNDAAAQIKSQPYQGGEINIPQ